MDDLPLGMRAVCPVGYVVSRGCRRRSRWAWARPAGVRLADPLYPAHYAGGELFVPKPELSRDSVRPEPD